MRRIKYPKERRKQKSLKSSSTLQLFGLILVAASGIIVSSVYFHWGDTLATASLFEHELGFTPPNSETSKSRPDNTTKILPTSQVSNEREEQITESATSKNTPMVQVDKLHPKGEVSSAVMVATTETPKQSSKQPTLEECLALNSDSWIKGPRIGNSQEGHITVDSGIDMILNKANLSGPKESGSIHSLLKETICHKSSRFLNVTIDGSDGKNSKYFWALRLIYLSFHAHQHKEAIAEAERRRDLGCGDILSKNNFGPFDFECPKAKFLVVPMGEMGLGAAMRLGAVNALFAGMATNRTILLINNAPVGERSIRKPWVHASCNRKDIQCFFMPPTPCTITVAELEGAYALGRSEYRRMFKFGEIPEEHAEDRVIIANFAIRPKATPPGFSSAIMKYADAIIQNIIDTTSEDDPRIEIIKQSKDLILEEKPFDREKRYYYFGVESQTHHAAVFYAMRPNPLNAEKMDAILHEIIPGSFNPELSFGLPIRASDKCLVESECLSFPQYMRLMGQIWNVHEASHGLSNASTSIVLTTESKTVLEDKKRFETNQTLRDQVPFDYNFVMNEHDVMQETGLPNDFMKNTAAEITADQIMLSAVSSLKAQLMAKFTVGNCCSNFHLLLFDFLQDGCGAAQDNISQCLQDNEDPEFRLCCQWTKNDECQAKAEAKREKEKLANEAKEQ